MNTSKEYIGTCSECGKENCHLTIVDEVTHVCNECLNSDWFQCDECLEYWNYDYVELFHLKDGRVVCEHCKEYFDESEIDYDF